MKIMIASDLHGSAYYTSKLIEIFSREKYDKLLLLGDILYHGPRNELPPDYSPKDVVSMLNPLAKQILSVRGNCDAEVDQMVLDFPIMADYCVMFEAGKTIYATHGHIFGENNLPKLQNGDILLTGHTHIPACVNHGYWYLNPGSVSIPKDKSWHGYICFENGSFVWKDFDGVIHMRWDIEEDKSIFTE